MMNTFNEGDYVKLKKGYENSVTKDFLNKKGTIAGKLGRLYVIKYDNGIIYQAPHTLEEYLDEKTDSIKKSAEEMGKDE